MILFLYQTVQTFCGDQEDRTKSSFTDYQSSSLTSLEYRATHSEMYVGLVCGDGYEQAHNV